MKRIVGKVYSGLRKASENSEGVYVVDKKKLRVKVQYIKKNDEWFFTVHRLKKDGKHTTFKSWYWTKYKYNPADGTYYQVRDGRYVWNSNKKK